MLCSSPGYTLTTFQYPIFEAALTGECSLASSKHELRYSQGRASMGDIPDDPRPEKESESTFKRASSMLDQLPQTEQEVEALRNAVMTKEGLLISVFDILRNVPRRVLMVFKLNDLTRYSSSL
jgi:aarF domain-containing kinase